MACILHTKISKQLIKLTEEQMFNIRISQWYEALDA